MPLPAGEVPTSVATGDFNGDGKKDWVVANGFDDNLWLYRGNGDGTTALPTILPLKGKSPVWVATADLRKRGRSDIVVAEHDSNTVGVLLSNGDGTFQPEQQLAAVDPDFVTVSDINGDGFPDIASGGIGCASVSLGDGQGNFQLNVISCAESLQRQGADIPDFTTFLSFADFNKDGKLDLLISSPGDGVEMMIADGSGHFSSPVRLVSGSTVSNAPYFFFTSTVIDFNSDGCPDAAVGDWAGKVFLFAGDCAGNFKHPASLTLLVGDVPAQLSVADINGDGHPDLVASGLSMILSSGGSSGHLLMVSLGDGQGGFQHAQVYRGGDNLVGFTVGDLNGDGKLDVLAVAQNENGLYEFLNDGTGKFGGPQGRSQFSIHGDNNQESFPFNVGGDFEQLLADINGDGEKDVLYIDFADREKTYSLAASLNQGAAGYSEPVFSTITTDGTNVVSNAVGDFHGTGQADLIVATDPTQPGGPGGTGKVYLMKNLGGGRFGPPSAVFPHANAETSMFATDLNKDGKQDLLISDLANGSGPQLNVLLGNGDGTFQAAVSYPLPSTGIGTQFFVGDFNGDTKVDVLLYLQENVTPRVANVFELLGNGDGSLQSPKDLFGTPGIPPFSLVDINHDGRPDIIAQSDDVLSPAITTYFGQSDGSFTGKQTYNSFTATNGLYLSSPPAGDFNQDGNVDVIVPLYQQLANGSYFHWAQFYSSNQSGSLTPTADFFDVGSAQPIWQVADMDGTGTPSVVEFDNVSLSFHVMRGTTAPPIQLFLKSEEIIGNVLQGTIVLNQIATTDTAVNLQTSDPRVSGATIISIPAGSTSQNFTLQVNDGFNISQVLAVTAAVGNYSTTAYAFDEAVITSLTVEAPNLSFDLQPINTTSPPLTVKIINNTTNAIALSNIVFDLAATWGFPDPDFSEIDDCHTAIPGGGSCSFRVAFTPTVGNKQEATELDFTDPTSGHVYRLVFIGVGSQPVALLTPSSLSFGSQTVGSTSASQTGLLSNNGTGVLHVSNTSVTGPFQLQNSCSAIPLGTPCQMRITFSPTAVGPQTGTLTVTTDGATPTQSITLSGTGIPAPTITISPTALSFGPVVAGTRSAPQTITLSNPGTTAVSLLSISVQGSSSYSQSGNCLNTLAPGTSCQVNVQFAPADGSAPQATLAISDNAVGSPQQATLTGQGVAFAINSTSGSQTIKSGSSATFQLSFSETAAYPESLTLSCSGLPLYATCAFTPASVNLTATTPVTSSLTISTNSTQASMRNYWPVSGVTLAAIGIPLLYRRRRFSSVWRIMVLFFATLTTLTLVACGGSGNTNGGGSQATPAGTYNITIVGSGRDATVQQKVTLVIQ